MIKTIIFKEIKELQRDTRFKISSVIVLLLLILAGFTGFNQYHSVSKQYETSEVKEREIWDNQKNKNPHSAAHDGTYVFKPRNVFSLLDNGINSYTGNVVFLEAHNRNLAAYGEAYDETEFARNNKLSLNFVLLYLFPLLILLIGFNIVTKEKEFDTLRLLKSQGVRPFQLVFGKWLSIVLVIFVASTVLFLLIGVIFSSIDINNSFSWVNLISIFAIYQIYYLVIITITILISTVSKKSGISLVSNLSIWVLFCFIMPKVATNITSKAYPFPTKQEFKSAIDKDVDENGFSGHNPNNKKGEEYKASLMMKYNVTDLEELNFNYRALLMQKSEEISSEIFVNHHRKLSDIEEKQQGVYQSLAFLSPFVPTKLLSMDLSYNGYKEDALFSNEVEKYRIVVQNFLNTDLQNAKAGEHYTMKDEKFKEMPKFSYQCSGFSTIIERNFSNIIIMLLWFAVSFLLLFQFSKKI